MRWDAGVTDRSGSGVFGALSLDFPKNFRTRDVNEHRLKVIINPDSETQDHRGEFVPLHHRFAGGNDA